MQMDPTQDVKPGKLANQLEQLRKVQNELRELLEQLNHKLTPVMSQETPPTAEAESDRNELCPLGEELFTLQRHLQTDAYLVNGMLSRLEC